MAGFLPIPPNVEPKYAGQMRKIRLIRLLATFGVRSALEKVQPFANMKRPGPKR